MHAYMYGEGEGERGGGGRVQGGRGKDVSAAVLVHGYLHLLVCIFTFSKLHQYSLTCNFICSKDTEETSYIQIVKNLAKSFW